MDNDSILGLDHGRLTQQVLAVVAGKEGRLRRDRAGDDRCVLMDDELGNLTHERVRWIRALGDTRAFEMP